MSLPIRPPASSRSRVLHAAIVVVNLILFLFPPVHLLTSNGDMSLALTYFLGAPIVLVISMFVLMGIDPNRSPEDES